MHASVERGDPGLWVAIPFKGPAGSKRRLAGLLDEDERARLSLAILDGVLDAVLDSEPVARVLLLMPSGAPPPSRSDGRLDVLVESARISGAMDGLNGALRQAQAEADKGGASRLLILPSDLPLVDGADVDALAAASDDTRAVIAPDRAEEGTNALVLAPPVAFRPDFGVGSFARHRQLAERAGLTVGVVRRPGLALDLDTPADIRELLAIDTSSRATRLLRALDIERRLGRLGALPAGRSGS
jgi:2-phospho-L-lactate guanylyltransferase